MNRKQFLKNCGCTLCSCAAVGMISPAETTAAENKPPEDWRLPFVKKRYAKLIEILADKLDGATLDEILRQLGYDCVWWPVPGPQSPGGVHSQSGPASA